MALFGTALTVLYDTRTKKCTAWQEMFPSSKAVIATVFGGRNRADMDRVVLPAASQEQKKSCREDKHQDDPCQYTG